MSRKRGVVSHRENPFLTATTAITTTKKRVVVRGGKAIVDTSTGEIEDVAEIVMVRQVDSAQFIKLFTQNLRIFFELSPVTMRMLQVLLSQVQKAPNTDRVMLNLLIVQEYFTEHGDAAVSKASFHRSIRELIEKQFIAETVLTGLYFINPNLFFNGDRVRFMTEIRRAKSRSEGDAKVADIVNQVKQLAAAGSDLVSPRKAAPEQPADAE